MDRKREIEEFSGKLTEFNRAQLLFARKLLEERLTAETLKSGEGLPRPWKFLSKIAKRESFHIYDALAVLSLATVSPLMIPALASGVAEGAFSPMALLLMGLSPLVLIPANGFAMLSDRKIRRKYSDLLGAVDQQIALQLDSPTDQPLAEIHEVRTA